MIETKERRPSPQQAEMLRTSGLYSEAVESFTVWLEANPNDTWSLAHRGAARASLGDHHGAIQDLERAISLRNGRYSWAHAQAGEARRTYVRDCIPWTEDNLPTIVSEIDQSVRSFSTAIAQAGDYAWAYAHKGAVHAVAYFIYKTFPAVVKGDVQHHFDEASTCFKTATTLNGAYTWAWAFHGLLYATAEEFGRAQALIGEALLRNVSHDMHQNRAMAELLYWGERYKESLLHGWLTRQADPEDILALYYIAQNLRRMGSPNAEPATDLALRQLRTLHNMVVIMIAGLYKAKGDSRNASETIEQLLGKQDMETLFMARHDPIWRDIVKSTTNANDPLTVAYNALMTGKNSL